MASLATSGTRRLRHQDQRAFTVGYSDTIGAPTGAAAETATGIALDSTGRVYISGSTASNATGGSLTDIAVTTPGSGYTSAPTIGFTGGGGTGAAATAVIGVAPSGITAEVAAGGVLFFT